MNLMDILCEKFCIVCVCFHCCCLVPFMCKSLNATQMRFKCHSNRKNIVNGIESRSWNRQHTWKWVKYATFNRQFNKRTATIEITSNDWDLSRETDKNSHSEVNRINELKKPLKYSSTHIKCSPFRTTIMNGS